TAVHRRRRQTRDDDPLLMVKIRMTEGRPFREKTVTDEQRDTGIGGRALTVAPRRARGHYDIGNFFGRRLDLLKTHNIRLFGGNDARHLTLSGADTVDVPGQNLHASARTRSPSTRRRAPSAADAGCRVPYDTRTVHPVVVPKALPGTTATRCSRISRSHRTR